MKDFAKYLITKPNQAAVWLQQGGLLAYPTESVWGIGCDPFNQAAVQTLLTLKSRPIEKGLIVITDKICRIKPLISVLTTKQQQQLASTWQPIPHTSGSSLSIYQRQQAHTWLLPIPDDLSISIPTWITGNHSSVAVRVITHPLIQQLCEQMVSATNPYGIIVSTSCNPTGKPPASSLQQAISYFADTDLANHIRYLQGDTLGYTLPSQIGDINTGKMIR
ncbi:L-threonylcarbamoyladenylate synthase [Psychrobacter sp. I-STPA10]|uniref:L-threonylcarbamoyladenylate synthase n=1 Tax=Psychrobacter sp. I-STPA10 TaxID=2585769 RepID=UPI001E3038EA|nr:Sua5/YciO/YrdC/YwlC family protein [Psychrobacter sp. I-STPA10]